MQRELLSRMVRNGSLMPGARHRILESDEKDAKIKDHRSRLFWLRRPYNVWPERDTFIDSLDILCAVSHYMRAFEPKKKKHDAL